MTEFNRTLAVASAGMQAQNLRVRVLAENIANAESLAEAPGGDPYRRQTVTFANTLDREIGANLVKVKQVGVDRSPFGRRFDPNHPAADEQGMVLTPNVQPLVEMSDLRAAQRSYEANLRVIDVARNMVGRTIDLLR